MTSLAPKPELSGRVGGAWVCSPPLARLLASRARPAPRTPHPESAQERGPRCPGPCPRAPKHTHSACRRPSRLVEVGAPASGLSRRAARPANAAPRSLGQVRVPCTGTPRVFAAALGFRSRWGISLTSGPRKGHTSHPCSEARPRPADTQACPSNPPGFCSVLTSVHGFEVLLNPHTAR